MIIAEILGGLGNQLFEYAHARALSIKLDKELSFDLSFFERYHIPDVYRLDKFNTDVKVADENEITRLKRIVREPEIIRLVYSKLGGSPFINSKYYFDNERIDSCSIETLKDYENIYISGYYANQQYFIEIEDKIRKEYTLKTQLNSENKKVLSQIKNSNSVSIHIRRGDYIGNNYFAQIPAKYYYDAIDYIEAQSPASIYFIFSDDINWVKNNFLPNVDVVYVDINDETTDYLELFLMASCKHNIIANSTFSWWGAWLNINPEKLVIAPKIWFQNKTSQKNYEKGTLIPQIWIKL